MSCFYRDRPVFQPSCRWADFFLKKGKVSPPHQHWWVLLLARSLLTSCPPTNSEWGASMGTDAQGWWQGEMQHAVLATPFAGLSSTAPARADEERKLVQITRVWRCGRGPGAWLRQPCLAGPPLRGEEGGLKNCFHQGPNPL